MEYRVEHDSMGEVRVPADKYWGAQTERSRNNFPIGVGLETMPREIIHAFGILKKAAAMANHALKPEKMTEEKLTVISQAADEVISLAEYGKEVQLEVKNHRIAFISSDCPDKVCIHNGWLSREGEQAICLPNRVSVTLTDGSTVPV